MTIAQIEREENLKSATQNPMNEPYCLAMVLCDAAHRDATTGKFTILGTFSTLAAEEFPAAVNFTIYFSITDGMGPTKLGLRIVPAAAIGDDQEHAIADFEFDERLIENPLTVYESVCVIGCEVPSPGQYHCELYCGDEVLMARRLLVLARRAVPKEDSDE